MRKGRRLRLCVVAAAVSGGRALPFEVQFWLFLRQLRAGFLERRPIAAHNFAIVEGRGPNSRWPRSNPQIRPELTPSAAADGGSYKAFDCAVPKPDSCAQRMVRSG